MGKPKRSREEILEQQRLRQQRRRERIKNDPDLYAVYKEIDRQRYHKKKSEGKILPINLETPARKKQIRKRNRENFKAYYRRRQQKKALETIEEVSFNETEPDVHVDLSPNITADPLSLSPATIKSRYGLRSLRNNQNQIHTVTGSSSDSQKTVIDSAQVVTENLPQPSSSTSTFNFNQTGKNTKLVRPISSTPTRDVLEVCKGDVSDGLSSIYSSPSSSHHPLQNSSSESSFAASGSEGSISVPKQKVKSPTKLAIRRLRYKSSKQIQTLNTKIHNLKRLNERYRKQIHRLQKNVNQINEYDKAREVVKQKQTELDCLTEETAKNVKKDVEMFLEQDENSRICPGKKEYITKNKIKKQKRFLTETLQTLHEKFINHISYKISYSTFCKMRPFWVLVPDVKSRETCMCKTHSNMDLMATALKRFNLINENSAYKILCSICCDPTNVECLTRRCPQCINKKLYFKEFENIQEIYYMHWISKKQTFVKDGNERTSNKIIKEKIVTSPKDVIAKFHEMLQPYMNHCANVISQSSFIKRLKANLKEDEVIIHVDYSENYNTKYATEIQSFHFAGSRQQITLHTVVMYYKKNGKLETQSLCTVSESLRHDAVAVWEHLMPILKHIEAEVPHVRVIHFISDSPSGQYRNKKMFFVITELHRDYHNLKLVSWNYTESGHGKGAPDGVGAVIKRTADRLVAQGNDIVDMQTLMNHLKTNVRGVLLHVVNESNILQKDLLFPEKLREFKGTMKVHQVLWSCEQPNTLAMRNLSCDLNDCVKPVQCTHGQHIGFYKTSHALVTASTTQITDEKENTQGIGQATSQRLKILTNVLVRSADNVGNSFKTPCKPDSIEKPLPKNTIIDSDLDLPSNDSFWVPVSPVQLSITTLSARSPTTNNKDYESDESDYNIF